MYIYDRAGELTEIAHASLYVCEKYKLPERDNYCFEVECIPTYILLSTLTAEGRKTIKEKPDRIREVNKEIEAFGAEVISQSGLFDD